jgi:hypothetical protein
MFSVAFHQVLFLFLHFWGSNSGFMHTMQMFTMELYLQPTVPSVLISIYLHQGRIYFHHHRKFPHVPSSQCNSNYYSDFYHHSKILPVPKVYINGIIQFFFLVSFTQHNVLRFIHVAYISNSFLFIT